MESISKVQESRGLPVNLSAKFKGSFAYLTVRDRLPVILTKVADTVYRLKNKLKDEKGKEAASELKDIVSCIGKLRHHLQTDKPLEPFKDSRRDAKAWNQSLLDLSEANNGSPITWFSTSWLYAECYMYRCIQEAVELTKHLTLLDVFEEQKQSAFLDSMLPTITLLAYLQEVTQELTTYSPEKVDDQFKQFLMIALWGNKCDLSVSAGFKNPQTECILKQLHLLQAKVIVDDSEKVIQRLRKTCKNRGSLGRVDVVLDNAGFELVTDLCLADYIVSAGLATNIYFHVKSIPWFVSDVTISDLKWTLDKLAASDNQIVSSIGIRWQNKLESGNWVVNDDDFWTSPHGYCKMEKQARHLYATLREADLVIFKGDLNYRKLVEDRQWSTVVPFSESLQGFEPSPLCILRTLKADVVTGLTIGQAELIVEKDKNWMTNGNWGIISYHTPI